MKFVGVAGRDGIEPIRSFIDDLGVDAFPHVVDETGGIWDQMGVVSQPAFIFLDASGESTSHLGGLGVDSLSERLDVLTSN